VRIQRFGSVDAHSGAPGLARVSANYDLHRLTGVFEQAPEDGSAAVAEERLSPDAPTCENGRHPSALARKTRVTDRVYALMDPMQAAGPGPDSDAVL
jgi:hypothetical protein